MAICSMYTGAQAAATWPAVCCWAAMPQLFCQLLQGWGLKRPVQLAASQGAAAVVTNQGEQQWMPPAGHPGCPVQCQVVACVRAW